MGAACIAPTPRKSCLCTSPHSTSSPTPAGSRSACCMGHTAMQKSSRMLQAFHPTVLVLAAGHGRRYVQSGGSTHKLEAMLGDATVLERVLRSVLASGLPYHVVRPVEGGSSPDRDGMGHSIARGVAATANADGWLILPGDLPLVRTQSLEAVAQSLASHAVVVPQCGDQQGHPVGFDGVVA